MIKIDKKKIINFSSWWDVNKALYEKAGIDKDIAFTIWKSAITALEDFLKALNKD